MTRLTSTLILLVLVLSSAVAQSAPDTAELTKLLNDFLAGASRNDPAVHDRFWADDLIYTRSAGRRVTKADIMRDVRSAPAPKPDDPKTVYTADDIRIQQYGDTAVVAFKLVSTTEIGGAKHVANLLNSGTFVKRNGKWQVVNWQSTRMPRTEEESKRELAEAETAFHQALAAADVSKLTALTDTTFTWTRGASHLNRKQLLDDLGGGRLKYVKPETSKSNVSIYSDAAVIRGETYTLTFVNQNGLWRAVSMHSTP